MTETAIVLAFPLVRRRAKVRAVANTLARKHGKAAEAYWKQTLSTIANKMDRQGVDRDEIKQELRAFFFAVQSELTRLAHDGRGTGGVA